MIAGHITLAASGIVKATGGAVVAVQLTAAADAASVILYDNPSAGSGVVLATLKAAIGASVVFCPTLPYAASKGIYATITGTAPSVTVLFL